MNSGFGIIEMVRDSIHQIRNEFEGTDEDFVDKIRIKLPELLKDVKQIFSKNLLEFYQSKLLDEIKEKENSFNESLSKEYEIGLNYFQTFIDLNKFIGKQSLSELENKVHSNDKLKLNLLLRLHSRACQVATEIQTLIKFGYADGAHARWRTLHEISVIFLVLIENDSNLSEMYADYGVIEQLKKAKSFQIQHDKINWQPIEEEITKKLQERKLIIETKYGKEFCKNYGWAMNILSKEKRHFRGLEESVQMDHLRPFYSWASENVHAGIDGISNRMSLAKIGNPSYLIFTAPSQYGLADPVQFTTYSLVTISSALISINENYENLILKEIIEDLHEKTKNEFFKVHLRIRKEIEE
jgi:hypothetical protein